MITEAETFAVFADLAVQRKNVKYENTSILA